MNNMESNPLDEQVIPTAIVIKNIPFSVKKDALLSKLVSDIICKVNRFDTISYFFYQ